MKPANILLDKNDDIKLADFGFAIKFEPGVPFVTKYGSPQYLAPEAYKKEQSDPTKIDIWAIGCILYELVTGEKLFDADSKIKIIALYSIMKKVVSKELR